MFDWAQTITYMDVMLFFLRSTPSLAAVIPTMGHIDMEFVTSSCNKKLLLSI